MAGGRLRPPAFGAPPFGGGVIGNTAGSGPVIEGSSPSPRAKKSLLTTGPREVQREVAQAVVLVAARPLRCAGQRDRIGPAEQLVEDHFQLETGQAGAEAVVGAVAEAEVRVGVAADVEPHRVGEHRLVAV